MKRYFNVLFMVACYTLSALCQTGQEDSLSTPVESKAADTLSKTVTVESNATVDTVVAVDSAKEQDSDKPDNVEKPSQVTSDISTVETGDEESLTSYDESDDFFLDILVDLSLGISLTEFSLKPVIATKIKPRILFDGGVLIPFKRWFFAGVSVRYLQLAVEMSKSYTTNPNENQTVSGTIKSDETLVYVSAPVKCGMRFELTGAAPYFYLGIEPAYLAAASQYTVEKVHTVYDIGGPEQFDEILNAKRVTRQRERHQLFLNAGIGLEIFYGYGSVYFNGGVHMALFDNDEPVATKNVIKRNSCQIMYFPLTIGIRFYL